MKMGQRDFNAKPPVVGEEIGLAERGHSQDKFRRAVIKRITPSGKQFVAEYKVGEELRETRLHISKWNGHAENGDYRTGFYEVSLARVEEETLAKMNRMANYKLAQRFEELLEVILVVKNTYGRGVDPTPDQLLAANSAAKLLAGACTTLSRNEPGVKETV